jgi:hypothetical protein
MNKCSAGQYCFFVMMQNLELLPFTLFRGGLKTKLSFFMRLYFGAATIVSITAKKHESRYLNLYFKNFTTGDQLVMFCFAIYLFLTHKLTAFFKIIHIPYVILMKLRIIRCRQLTEWLLPNKGYPCQVIHQICHTRQVRIPLSQPHLHNITLPYNLFIISLSIILNLLAKDFLNIL